MSDEKKIQEQADEMSRIAKDLRGFMEANETKQAELKSRVEKMKADLEASEAKNDKLSADMKALAEAMAEMEAKATRPPVETEVERKATQRSGMRNWFAKDFKGVSPEEMKTLNAEDDPSGGYLVLPPYLEMEIVDQALPEVSPMRQYASVRTVGTSEYWLPAKTAHAVCGWVADAGTTSEDTTLQYGIEKIPVHGCTALYKARQTNLDDAGFDLEAEIKGDVGAGFALLEGTAFFSGTGIGQPEGFLSNSTIISNAVFTAASGAVDADAIMGLWGAPKSAYTQNAVFMMARATMVDCLQLKTGDGTYLLNRLGDSPNWMMLGHKVVEAAAMPAVAANAYAIAFGDFKRGYRIIDRRGIQVIRDPFTSKTTQVVEFMFSRRVGGAVINPEAIYVLKLATS